MLSVRRAPFASPIFVLIVDGHLLHHRAVNFVGSDKNKRRNENPKNCTVRLRPRIPCNSIVNDHLDSHWRNSFSKHSAHEVAVEPEEIGEEFTLVVNLVSVTDAKIDSLRPFNSRRKRCQTLSQKFSFEKTNSTNLHNVCSLSISRVTKRDGNAQI